MAVKRYLKRWNHFGLVVVGKMNIVQRALIADRYDSIVYENTIKKMNQEKQKEKEQLKRPENPKEKWSEQVKKIWREEIEAKYPSLEGKSKFILENVLKSAKLDTQDHRDDLFRWWRPDFNIEQNKDIAYYEQLANTTIIDALEDYFDKLVHDWFVHTSDGKMFWKGIHKYCKVSDVPTIIDNAKKMFIDSFDKEKIIKSLKEHHTFRRLPEDEEKLQKQWDDFFNSDAVTIVKE